MNRKKQIRAAFRAAVFERDKYRCVMCGKTGQDRQSGDAHKKYHHSDDLVFLDAHHITDRNLFPHGGYVKQNGISVCENNCHLLAEQFHQTGIAYPGYSPEDLYNKINSSFESAMKADAKNVD